MTVVAVAGNVVEPAGADVVVVEEGPEDALALERSLPLEAAAVGFLSSLQLASSATATSTDAAKIFFETGKVRLLCETGSRT
jgi:hypothetical protein